MRFSIGEKIKVTNDAFTKVWKKTGNQNEWIIDRIKTQRKGYPSLYICRCIGDKSGLQFHFQDKEVEKC